MAVTAKKKQATVKKPKSTNGSFDIEELDSKEMLVLFLQDIKTSIHKLDQNVNSRIDKLDQSVNSRIDKLDQSVNSRIDKLDNRIDRLDNRIDRLDQSVNGRIDKLDNKIDRNFRWTIGIIITSLGITISGFMGLVAIILSKL